MLTIITASYNSEKTIRKTIESLLNQSCTDFEFIIIDGNSKDKTLEIIKSFESAFREREICYKYLSESDTGIYDAWNKGLKMASRDWIAFLGSDDFYLEDALKSYAEVIINNKSQNYDLVYSNVKVVEGDKTIKVIDGKWSWNIFKRYMNIAHVGSFHSKRYFDKYGCFDTSYRIAGDYEFLLRAKNNLKALKISKVTAIMEAGGISNSQILNVFKETLHAKHKTAKLNIVLCYYDLVLAHIKYNLKKKLY